MSGDLKRRGLAFLAAALVILTLACLLQAVWGYSHGDLSGHATGSDDAYISYRYALNLLAGHGLVFNPGERVEGYTNLLYVLLMVPALWLVGPDGLYAVSVAVNLGFAALALILIFGYASQRLGSLRAGIAALIVALCPSIWVAVASGLETPLVLLLQVAIWIAVERAADEKGDRQVWVLAGLSVLLIITRADGFVFPGLAAVYLFLRGRRRAALGVAVAAATATALVMAWRLSYYGWPLPNTYYAKVAGPPMMRIEASLEQLILVMSTTGMLIHLFGLLLLLLDFTRRVSRLREPVSSALSFPVLAFLPWIAYWLYVGGDVFYERFLLILFPMGAYAILSQIRDLRFRALATVVCAVCAVQLIQLPTDPRFAYLPRRYDRWVLLGRHLGEHHPGATLASDAVGKVPYFSGLRTLDMLGLTDLHIGHLSQNLGWAVGHKKTDTLYVLDQRPDLIAAWIYYSLDLEWGLERRLYEPAGYRVRYVINTGRDPMEPNLIDVTGMSEEEVSRKVALGYGYAVLELERESVRKAPAVGTTVPPRVP